MTSLNTPHIGALGFEPTRVGLGSWAMGGGEWVSAWGAQDDSSSVSTIRHAVECGVNWIDTAAVYGLGHAEEVVAEALAPYSDADRPRVFTKGGMVWDESDRTAPSRRMGDETTLRSQVDASLRRLGVDAIDVYFMHWPATAEAVEEYWQTLVSLRAEGKLRAIGLSNHTVEDLDKAEAIGHIDVIQPPFSAVVPSAARDLLPWSVAHDTAVVVYSPMGSGLLTGAFSRARVAALPENDWRRHSPLFTDQLDANLAVADAMGEIASRRGTTVSAVAVAWTLGFPGVTAAIVGARDPRQVDDWISAGDLVLTPEEYASVPTEARPGS
ncbi:aldo/keto reductase [Glaciibacter superstes]|uniref:aldo/keto reductase n=1 Tax=Glaciibacter superstes TaxID=501023 RepID=UPI0003B5C993|nr:aldo/keto reductase [Glaciibacter superstes]